jgi:DNA-binding transcriptional ArsR family regulator
LRTFAVSNIIEQMSQELRRFKAEIFQALAHPTRIAIVEALDRGEVSAGHLIGQLGLEQANASQHLAVLRSKQIVTARKEGNQVFYSLRDPVLLEVLKILKNYFHSQLSQTMSMLKEIRTGKGASRK